jgi:GNAT superfamily N-acetyltransferase
MSFEQKYLKYKQKYLLLKKNTKIMKGGHEIIRNDHYIIHLFRGGTTFDNYDHILTFGEPEYSSSDVVNFFQDPMNDIYVVYHDGKPKAFAIVPTNYECDTTCFDCKKLCVYVSLLCVDGPHRKQGIFRGFLDLIYSYFRGRGETCIRATASKGPVNDIYRSLGFTNEVDPSKPENQDCIYKLSKNI